ncbi:MAG: methyltransferase domain-containing protein [Burkholderiales bacterium]|nr:methyltransferase domain-containing protein [Burkholderiales bacterium]
MSAGSARRPISSYAKVQAMAGRLLRNRRFQLRAARIRGVRYLDIGCGRNCHSEFINLDYQWHSGVDVCWDIGRGLPFADGAMRGVFSEHCLEHFSMPEAKSILRECRRVLADGGILRVVVPDAELYLTIYGRQIRGDASVPFPYQSAPGADGPESPILHVNRVFYQDRESPQGHRAMYDLHLLERMLHEAGFATVEKVAFRAGRDPALLVDAESRACESLYVEAIA